MIKEELFNLARKTNNPLGLKNLAKKITIF